MDNCRHSCEDAFIVEKDPEIKSSLIQACNKGCDIDASNPLRSESLKTDVMKPTEQSKPKSIFDIVFGDDIFSGLEPNDRYTYKIYQPILIFFQRFYLNRYLSLTATEGEA